MKLMEVFNKPSKITWDNRSKDMWEGYFDVGEGKYHLVMFPASEYIIYRMSDLMGREDRHIWEIIFSSEDPEWGPSTDITGEGKGKQFAVFATVISGIKQLLAKQKIDVIIIASKEKSRNRLYNSLIRRFAPSLGFKLNGKKVANDEVYFVLGKK